jgi:SsrA-binding protein
MKWYSRRVSSYLPITHGLLPSPAWYNISIMVKEEKQHGINISNRKAWHEYSIEDQFECGIVLAGTEVKSIRAGKASIAESHCKVENGEVWIHGMYIAPYEQGNRYNVDPLRPRKLMMKKIEILKIHRQLQEKGLTLVPLKLYFTRGYAKLNVGLGRGKKLYDKRDAIAARDVERDRRREEAGRN